MHDDWSLPLRVADFQRGPEVARPGARWMPDQANGRSSAGRDRRCHRLAFDRLAFQLPEPDHATANSINNEPNTYRNYNRAYDNGRVWLLADLQVSAGDVFQHSGPLPSFRCARAQRRTDRGLGRLRAAAWRWRVVLQAGLSAAVLIK